MRISLLLAAALLWAAAVHGSAALAQDYCFERAAAEYDVPAAWLWAIAKVESNFDPMAVNSNADGSVDIGVMQINSWWAQRYGPELWSSLSDTCTNIRMGAFVLADCMARYGRNWQGVGCYNAAAPEKRLAYARKVDAVLQSLRVAAQ